MLSAWEQSGFLSPLIVNRKDGSTLVQVPAGEFEMGDGQGNDCPAHRVYLAAYWIGVYAVTNRQYEKFVKETGHRAPDQADWGEPIWKGKSYPKEYAEHPVVCVSWEDAAAYCKWAGGRLPTEAEWEKAARGPKGHIYPWGKEWDAGRCRNSTNKGWGTTCEVYGYAEGASGYGAYNLSGNVWEWCGDWYDANYYKQSPRENPPGPGTGSRRVNRGGSWGSGDAHYFRGANRGYGDPAERRAHVGFRLALAPVQQPGKQGAKSGGRP